MSAHASALTRSAAIQLIVSIALLLAGSSLLLWATVGNPPPAPSDDFGADLPGVDLTGLTPSSREAVLRRLNRERCPCDCLRTVAGCRRHHACSLSLAAAREAVRSAEEK